MYWSIPYNDGVVYIVTIKHYVGCKRVIVGDVQVLPISCLSNLHSWRQSFPHGCAIVLNEEGAIKLKIIIFEEKLSHFKNKLGLPSVHEGVLSLVMFNSPKAHLIGNGSIEGGYIK